MNPPTCPSFILCAANKEARKVTEHQFNFDLRCPVGGNTFSPIGLQVTLSPEKVEVLLGHDSNPGAVDIYIPEGSKHGQTSSISALQASFFFNTSTGAILLCDRSERRNTETVPGKYGYGQNVQLRSSKRSVLVAHGVNDTIAFGREEWYKFQIIWLIHGLYHVDFPAPTEEPYRLGPSRCNPKKYVLGSKVGGGAYGTVWSCVDVTTGNLMAVKKFSNLSGKAAVFASREIQNLTKINKDQRPGHEHVLEILGTEGGNTGDSWGELFMPLKLGNLKTLVENTPDNGLIEMSDKVLRQMLSALICLASYDIVHRDVKPENILWEDDNHNDYHFRLADFGLSNDSSVARTVAGTEPFMAPEVYYKRKQTKKVDIWSLFATIFWIRDKYFRHECPTRALHEIHTWLNGTAMRPEYIHIGSMASIDPSQRPSAQTLLQILDSPIDGFTGMMPGSSLSSSPMSGGDLPPALDARFGAMNLKGDDRDFPDDIERRYYEPYQAPLGQLFGRAGESSRGVYTPPPGGLGPKQMPSAAFVKPGGQIYGEPGGTYDDGTVVPEIWTARAGKMTQFDDSQVRVMDTGATSMSADISEYVPWDAGYTGPSPPPWDPGNGRPSRRDKKGKWKYS